MITSHRLEIKPWTLDLAEDFFQLAQDPGFTLFPINNYRQASVATARGWLELTIAQNKLTGMGKWAVWEKNTGELLGMGGLTPWKLDEEELVDITYRLRESSWGRGYGIELAQALVDYGFGVLGLNQITATITPENEASKKVAAKLGLKYDQKIVLLGVPTEVYRLQRSAKP